MFRVEIRPGVKLLAKIQQIRAKRSSEYAHVARCRIRHLRPYTQHIEGMERIVGRLDSITLKGYIYDTMYCLLV